MIKKKSRFQNRVLVFDTTKPQFEKNPKPKNFAKNTHYLHVKTINYKEKKTIVIIVCIFVYVAWF